jgi:4-amino-4-deoxy-L-arabinose transferase-like glycosyltransferase
MDADLNHEPEEIPRLLEEIQRRDLDVLVGSRFIAGSRNEGIPLWKWVLSILMNRLIASLFDVEIRDKTSGFRIYRADALRRLTGYRNNDFAFLAEMLIRATDEGLRIGEAPIHFTFRTRGESKMSIPKTSRSYLILLRSRFDTWSVVALVFLTFGVGARLLYAFPVHKYVPDADSLLSGIRAFDILHGKFRIFYSYVRIGALESYMHAASFLVLGPSRTAVALAPLLSGALTLLAFFFLVRELFGRRVACFALLVFALPSPSYLAWTYMPNGYPETMLLSVCTLYFAARIARTGFQPLSTVALGLCAGLGFWNSLQTLVCTIPALVWLFFKRRSEILAKPGYLAALAGSFTLGALPWILYNVRYSFPSLLENFAARPAHGVAEVLSNARYFFLYNVRELTIGLNPLFDGAPVTPLEGWLQIPAAVLYGASALLLAVLPAILLKDRAGRPRAFPFLLLWLILATVAALYASSAAGETRGYTVRYVLPLYIPLAVGVGLLTNVVWQRSRLMAVVLAGLLVVFDLSGYYFPWTAQRHHLRDHLRLDADVVRFLETNQIRWVCGNYWVVYPFVFESGRTVLGIPSVAEYDHYGFAQELPARPGRWALVGRDRGWLRKWVGKTGLRGQIVAVGTGYSVFIPDGREEQTRSTQKTLALLQQTAPWGY